MRRQLNGILLLDKPLDMTSNRALQTMKYLFNAKKAGHTGSLDPLATGMLPICFGEATKFSQYLLASDKSYQVVAKLGERTTTGDREGEVVETKSTTDITLEKIQQIATQFMGDIQQIPPMFSAIKHQGQPLYHLARKGIEIEREPRTVTIFSLQIIDYVDDQLSMNVHCSKGTYIRALVEDMGAALGCGAHVSALRRPTVSPYGNAKMYTLVELEKILQESGMDELDACLIPIETSVQTLPSATLSESIAFYIRNGQPVRMQFPVGSTMLRLFSEDARFLGVGEVMPDGRVRPHRMLPLQDVVMDDVG